MDDIRLVCVYETGSPFQAEIVKAMLESEDIPASAHGGKLPDLFGWGRLSTGYNVAIGMVKVRVRDVDAERAKALIAERYDGDGPAAEIPEEEWENTEEAE